MPMPLDTTDDKYARAYYESAGPTLLAEMPPTLPGGDAQPDENWNEIFQRREARLNSSTQLEVELVGHMGCAGAVYTAGTVPFCRGSERLEQRKLAERGDH